MMEYNNSDFIEIVKEKIHHERNRQIIIDRFVDGLTFPQLAEKYDLSERQVKRIVKTADAILVHI